MAVWNECFFISRGRWRDLQKGMLFPLLDLEEYENKGRTSQRQTWTSKTDVLARLSFAGFYFFEGLLGLLL